MDKTPYANNKIFTDAGRHSYKLSIVVPCYKVEQYLPRCLDSLVGQTLEDIEIVCVNDGSPDGCLSILKEYRERYGSRIVIIDKKNGGVWKARKDGIMAASGEYIGFVDPDDYVHRDYAAKLYEAAVGKDADIACCGFYRIDSDTGKTLSTEMTKFRYDVFDIQKEPGLLPEVNIALWNKIFRAGIIKRMYDISRVPKVQDDLMFANLIYINAGVITFVNEALVYYMIRSGSVISSFRKEYIPDIYSAMKELRDIYRKNNRAMLDYIDAEAFLHLGIVLMHRLSKEKEFRRILKNNTAFLDKEFPGWRKNPYITFSYVTSHRRANFKLLIIRTFYRLHLFGLFLKIYGFMIDHFKRDVKW